MYDRDPIDITPEQRRKLRHVLIRRGSKRARHARHGISAVLAGPMDWVMAVCRCGGQERVSGFELASGMGRKLSRRERERAFMRQWRRVRRADHKEGRAEAIKALFKTGAVRFVEDPLLLATPAARDELLPCGHGDRSACAAAMCEGEGR